GGNYTRETVIGHDLVESYGGKVIIISIIEGSSTTKTIETIKGRSFKKDLPKCKGGYIS
ncbi:hypothetical protein LCGC14_2568410, partial [marine sediment metagenome]